MTTDVSSSPRSRVYTILGLIGEGGFGRVYRARLTDGDFSKDVAIKLLRDASPSPDLLARFRDEARILALLRDRAVVSVEPPIELAGRWAVVMDFVDGLSLHQILSHIGTVPAAVAMEIVAEVARAIDKAYRFPGPDGEPLRLLHRDIKPANIQITPSGEVRLLDFGTARADFANREAETIQDISGTPGYLAPERLEGTEGPEGDVFSLGVTLWAILTREGPSKRKYADLDAGVEEHAANDPDLEAALRLAIRMRYRDPEGRPALHEVQSLASRAARSMPGPHLDEWCTRIPHRALEDDELSGQALTETIHPVPTLDGRGRTLILGGAGLGAGVVVAGALAAGLFLVAGLGAFIWTRASVDPPPPEPVVTEPVEPVVPVAPPPPKAVEPAVAGTTFESDPPGATVWIDGVEVGATPLKNHVVEPGEHTLRLKKGLFVIEGKMTVDADTPATYHWTAMQGAQGLQPPLDEAEGLTVRFESTPAGATVTLDGESRGETPLDLAVPPGRHTLALKKGVFEVQETIEVAPGGTERWTWAVMQGSDGLEPQ